MRKKKKARKYKIERIVKELSVYLAFSYFYKYCLTLTKEL